MGSFERRFYFHHQLRGECARLGGGTTVAAGCWRSGRHKVLLGGIGVSVIDALCLRVLLSRSSSVGWFGHSRFATFILAEVTRFL